MTTTTLTHTAPPAVPEPAAAASAPVRLLRHSLTLAHRSVLRMRRTPEQFVDVTLQPIIFLLMFVYLFGGAVAGSTQDYLQYVLPAIMVQTVMFCSAAIGVNLNDDIKKGLFDRFRSLPIARSAPLIGAVIADVVRYATAVTVLLAFGMIMGFRVETNALSALAACLLVILFAMSLSWVFVLLGLKLRSAGAVQGIGFLVLFPVTFGSNLFVPTDTLPGWLQAWVHVNPVTHVVAAARGLMLGGPVATPVAQSLMWCAILVAVFAPLGVRAYRRRT